MGRRKVPVGAVPAPGALGGTWPGEGGPGADPSIELRAPAVVSRLGSERGVAPEQGCRDLGLPPISLPEAGEMWAGQARSPVIPCTTGTPKVPVSLRHERPGPLREGAQALFPPPDCPPPSSGEGWSLLGGRRDWGQLRRGKGHLGTRGPRKVALGGTPARRYPSL